jgi:ABC-type antimicrobial peptide transport system permease subunit
MIKNYFKIAWRNIARNRVYTAINVLGLSLGVCACIVIYVIISFELSFDTFHPNKERIYRVIGDATESTGEKLHWGKLPLPLSATARQELTGFDAIAGVVPFNAKVSIPQVTGKPATHFSNRVWGSTIIAEPQYFDIFKYTWLSGNAATALNAPFTVVLTESVARQYFGPIPTDEIIGKQLIYDDSIRVSVSGVVKDWNKNSDLAFTDLISFSTIKSSNYLKNGLSPDSWSEGDMSTWIFAKLSKGTLPAQLNSKMTSLVKRHADPKMKLTPWFEPLADIHFNANVIENPIRTAHLPTLYSLMAIALFILILAVINFINLSTAQSIRRAKEVGVRKVLGSSRTSLIFQFLTETLILTLFAVALAVLLVNPVLTTFRSFIPAGVTFYLFNPSTMVFLVLVTVVTSLLAGLYPAKVLSAYLPALSLKGSGAQRGGEKWLLRKGLIIFQFAVSLIFIIGTIVIASQLNYTRNKDLGFTSDAIITVETTPGDSLSKVKVVAQKVKQLSGVSNVALAWATPGKAAAMRIKFKSTDVKETEVAQVDGDENLIPMYRIKLLAGRNLAHSDSVNEFVINETLARFMGYKTPEQAIGKILYWFNKPYPIVGVVADFHSSSLHAPIVPLCIINRVEREGTLAIQLAAKGKQANNLKATLTQIEKAWKSIYPAGTFDYRFYDESIALMYEKDRQTATLMNTAMSITIFISCIGLFGLALFTAEKKAKEISIRKILGASTANIAAMLSMDFIILIVIALFIASPIAWYFMNQWLHSFAYRIDISLWIFILAGLGAIFIALITVSFQAIKAALINPVKSLKTE